MPSALPGRCCLAKPTGAPKTATGQVEAIRLLQVARRSAMKARIAGREPDSTRSSPPPPSAAPQPHRTRHDRVSSSACAGSVPAPSTTRPRREAHPDGPRPPLAAPRPPRSTSSTFTSTAHHRDARRRSSRSTVSAPRPPPRCSPPPATTPTDSAPKDRSPRCAAPRHSTRPPADNNDTDSTAAATATPTPRSTSS